MNRFVALWLAEPGLVPKLPRMKQILFALIAVCGVCGASAQSLVTENEEQYARSQAARADAIAAFRAGDLETAYSGMIRALEDRPSNTALLGNAIFLAAETNRLDEAIALNARHLALGVAPAGAIQAKLKEKLPADRWIAVEEKITALSKPVGAATKAGEIPTNYRLVEGVASDGEGGFFLSTVVSGAILFLDTDGKLAPILDGRPLGANSFFGLAYDKAENSLYATYGRVDQTPGHSTGEGKTGVLRIDVASKTVTGNWFLEGGTDGQQIAGIAISPAGRIFVSEAQSGNIYEVKSDSLKALETEKTFRSPQGMAFMGGFLWLVDYGRGLWKIDIAANQARLLPVPENVSLVGIDGLLNHNDRLIAIQNGVTPHRVIEINLDAKLDSVSGIKILVQNLDGFDEPTLGSSTAGGIVFVASSQWPKFAPGGEMRDGQTYNPTSIMLIKD